MGLKVLDEAARALQNIPVARFIRELAPEVLPLAVELQREQLESGLTSEGQNHKIKPKYKNPEYAAMKNAMNPKAGKGTPDLKLTGAFHESVHARIGAAGIEFYSTDPKAEILLAKYENVLGLTPKNRAILSDTLLKPLLAAKVTAYVLSKLKR